MASQFAPNLRIIRPANVPLIRIDGLEDFKTEGGWEFSSYFVRDRQEEDIAYICLDLMVRPGVRLEMRRLIEDATTRLAAWN